jgi:hypothetical protein
MDANPTKSGVGFCFDVHIGQYSTFSCGQVELVTEKAYNKQSATVRNAYRAGHELVLQFGGSLPDVCVACGSPAWGNVEKKEFPTTPLWWLLPTPFDIIGLIFGTRYVFDFPFCSNCSPELFQLKPTRLDSHLAVFVGASGRLLELLPSLPPDVAAEKNSTWLQRKFR